eukprot:5830763-Prymnesium_polylepis.1
MARPARLAGRRRRRARCASPRRASPCANASIPAAQATRRRARPSRRAVAADAAARVRALATSTRPARSARARRATLVAPPLSRPA